MVLLFLIPALVLPWASPASAPPVILSQATPIGPATPFGRAFDLLVPAEADP
jgi:hypothetical protein